MSVSCMLYPGFRSLEQNENMWFGNYLGTRLLPQNVTWVLQPEGDCVHRRTWLIYHKKDVWLGRTWHLAGLSTDSRMWNSVKDFHPVSGGVRASCLCMTVGAQLIVMIKSGKLWQPRREWIWENSIKKWSSSWIKHFRNNVYPWQSRIILYPIMKLETAKWLLYAPCSWGYFQSFKANLGFFRTWKYRCDVFFPRTRT